MTKMSNIREKHPSKYVHIAQCDTFVPNLRTIFSKIFGTLTFFGTIVEIRWRAIDFDIFTF